MYSSLEQARRRLRNSIVLFEGEPVLVQEIRRAEGLENRPPDEDIGANNLTATFRRYPADPQSRLARLTRPLSDEGWSKRPFRLGYVNPADDVREGSAPFYCSRQISRRGVQGFSADEMGAEFPLFGEQRGAEIRGYNPHEQFFSRGLADTIKGIYPSFQQCLDYVTNEARKERTQVDNLARAFDHDFCLSSDIYGGLHIFGKKGVKIASHTRGDRFQLSPYYLFLKESLEELGVAVND